MGVMMKPESIFTFGKYKGDSIMEVASENPSYLYWMLKTGFSDFGKEVTQGIFAWEEANHTEAAKTLRSIEKKKEKDAALVAVATVAPVRADYATPPPIVITKEAPATWGSW